MFPSEGFMPTWKVLLVALLACICLALTLATILITLDEKGTDRWIWLGGLLAATVAVGTLLVFFLRHAGSSMDTKPGWTRR
jgi:hypothetical protein